MVRSGFGTLLLGSFVLLWLAACSQEPRDVEPRISMIDPQAVSRTGADLQREAPILIDRTAFAEMIGEREVSFFARDMETGEAFVLEGSAPDVRRTPWSTFKIPNLVLALESGVAADLDHIFPWNEARRPPADFWPQAWRQDQTLGSAFRRSAVWVFQDIALEMEPGHYAETLHRWSYGDAEVAAGSDIFWLDHTLEISPREQVDFLGALLAGRLGVSPETLQRLDEAARAGERADGVLYGKTGSGPVEPGDFDGRFEGWYVGYLRRSDRAPIVFALHVEASSFSELNTFRRSFAEALLSEITASRSL